MVNPELTLKRRTFLGGFGAMLSCPLVTKARADGNRTIGMLGMTSFDSAPRRFSAFREGLKETGYVEGRNITIEYRLADGQRDRLPSLAAELEQVPA
jgi:putative tryptophan/tyrosine transport system substrate-binding protein